jgi:6-phosphogluconolactonase (cycloisomerase 2 family)
MKRILGLIFICLLVSQVVFSGSPGHLFRTTVRGATLTVNSTIPNWTYPYAGISSSQSGVSFSGCSLNSNGQCIFSVSDTQSASLTMSGATTPIVVRLCLDGYGNTYNCENVTVELPGSAYVTNYTENGQVSLCSVDSRTGALSNNCTRAGYSGNLLRRVVLNSAATLAYVVNEDVSVNDGGIILCQVNPTTRLLTSCLRTAIFTAASDIVFNLSGTRAYVTDVTAGTISRCIVNTSTGALSECSPILSSIPLVTGIVLNPAGTIAYYSQAGNVDTISYCSVNSSSGVLSNCLVTGSGFNDPEAVTLNPSGTYAYISNNGNGGSISVCRVDAGTGALSACTNTSDLFSGRGGVEFNATGTLAYFPSFTTNLVYQCNVNSSTGLLSNCVNSGGAPFTDPSGLAFINY